MRGWKERPLDHRLLSSACHTRHDDQAANRHQRRQGNPGQLLPQSEIDFNWTLLRGGGSLPAFEGDPAGEWHFTQQQQDLGEGTTFSGARGIPMLLVDDVPLSGGGVTIDPRFDTTYTGRSYFAIGINQTTPNPNCNHIAHELWHVASGSSAHDPANGTVTSCTGQGVSSTYCDGLRALV